jgi:hypothetical protein
MADPVRAPPTPPDLYDASVCRGNATTLEFIDLAMVFRHRVICTSPRAEHVGDGLGSMFTEYRSTNGLV